MTSEHDSAAIAATSLLANGEVCEVYALQSLRAITDAYRMPIVVVDDSGSGKENACEYRRTDRIRPSKGCLTEVRAVVVVRKRGSACGAKDGRKVNDLRP